MRKIFTLLVFSFVCAQFASAQVVVRDEKVNFMDMVAWEKAHPELVKPCPTCPKKEADNGWEEFATSNQPIPPGGTIKMSQPLPKKNPNAPTPDVPSRAPVQQWLGRVDVGSIIPPDTYGAVGNNHVITALNDVIRIHAKVGGAQISQVSISTFTGVASTCDPQLFFDPSSQRWIFAAIRCTGSNDPIIVMRSDTDDPTGGWRNFQFIPVPGGIPDHPYLGFDDTKIVIGARKFNPSFSGPDLYLIDKADFLANVAITFGVNAQTISQTPAQGDSPRPVTVYFPPYSNSGNPSPGTIYILQSWNNTSLRLTTVTGNIPSAVWNTGSAVFPTAPAGEAWTAGNHGTAGSVQQPPPETRRLASNDSRVSSAVMMNGKIWCSQHCAFPAGASGTGVTHTDVQYWQLEGNPGGTFGNVLQRGRTGAVAGQHRWFSSIALNKNEDVVVGYSNSDATALLPSASYSTRQASTPVNTLDDPLNFHVGEGRYWKDFGSGRPRWGDYSQSHLDPIDNSIWTTQQYAATPVGSVPPDNNSRWGTWWAQIPPSTPSLNPVITAAGYTLISESCVPANGVVDPGETVTISFCIQNTGTANTVSAVGTLLASGGVLTPSGPQNYGVVTFGGPAVCRNFTFTNSITSCGGSITASLQVQDGAANLGTVTYNIPIGTTTVLTTQNFDAVVVPALPAGWASAGSPAWTTSNSGTPTPASFSAPNAALVANVNFQDSRLTAPVIAVTQPGTTISFRNNFNVEQDWDGGVLEISTNGGGTWTDIIAAGGTWLSGGYNGTLNGGTVNVLQGRAAWTGTSGGFLPTSVRLPNSTVGQNVLLRFRMGSDDIVTEEGWRIDDLVVTFPSCCAPACTITCPANITTTTSGSQCGAIVNFTIGASGLCGTITATPASGSLFPVGTTTVNVVSSAGPTCSFTVTVTDGTPPTITCPATVTVNNAPGQCGQTVNYPYPTVGDNCPLTGGTSVTMNQSTNTTTITPISIGCQSGGNTTANSWWRAYNLAPLNLPAGLSIRSVRFGIERSQFSSGSVTGTIRIWRSNGAFPAASRTLLSTQNVVIANQTGTFMTVNLGTPATAQPTDIIAVELNLPEGRFAPNVGAFFIGSNALGEAAPSYLSAADCGVPNPTPIGDLVPAPLDHIHLSLIGEYYTTPPTLQQLAGLPRGAFFPVGTTLNTYRATDAAGNQSTCSFNVVVVDNEQPTISCPANVVINTDLNQCYATFTPAQPTFADNCAVTRVTWSITNPLGAVTNSPATGINYVPSTQFILNGTTGFGISTVTYTAADAAGNTRTCSFTVRVNDAQIPVITAQPATKFVCVGSPGAFPILATANGGPITYQWQEWNGSAWVNITGATAATFTIPAVSFTDNTRTFRCILTGRCTVVTSNVATLYVNPLPTVSLLTSIPPSLTPGQSLTISSNVSPGGGSYAWFKNNVLIAGATGSSLTGLTVDDIGTYKLTYTDPNGCVSTTADVVVSGQPTDKMWVYPNPNSGAFQVRFFNQTNESATVRVFDAKGALIYERAVVTTTAYTGIEVDLGPTIPDAVYVVELVNSAGKRVDAKKIVVRKKP